MMTGDVRNRWDHAALNDNRGTHYMQFTKPRSMDQSPMRPNRVLSLRHAAILAVRAVLIALIFLACPRMAQAQVNAGVLFLRIAPGARAAGMGEAFVALADDATATHYNPAGLGIYPLNSEWDEYEHKSAGRVRDAVPLRNGLPGEHVDAHDLWLLTDDGLAVFRSGQSGIPANAVELSTGGMRSITSAIRRYAPFLSEGEADDIARGSAARTVGIPAEEFAAMMDKVHAAIPEDYRDRTVMENVIRELGIAHREGRLVNDRIPELRTAITALRDGPADATQLDRVRFAMEHATGRILPSNTTLSLSDIIRPPVTAITGDGSVLYVAAGNGLLEFNGDRWSMVPAPDQAEDWSEMSVHALDIAAGGRLWVGTDNGILVRHSGQWARLGPEMGLPSGRVDILALHGASTGWVYGSFGLARYDGNRFGTDDQQVLNVGDDLESLLSRYLDSEDAVRIAAVRDEVVRINNLDGDAGLEPGDTVLVPYSAGVRGEITAMTVDTYGRLWVGSNLGSYRFARGAWTSYGYSPYISESETTTEAVATLRLGQHATPARVQRLARYIRDYNGLPDDNIPADRTIYVYRNPAGAEVNDLLAEGNDLLIATSVGQLAYESGKWDRYFHADLDHDAVRAIARTGDDLWFVTDERVVVFRKSHKEVSLMHAPWLPEFNLDLYFEYLTFVTNKKGYGTFGAAITFLTYGEIPRTDEFGNVVDLFHSFDLSTSISYGTRLSHNLAAGLTAKIIYSRLADQGAGTEIGSGSAVAFALDAGFLYNTPWKRLTLGGAVTNLGPDISYIDAQQSDPLPRNLGVGFAYKLWDSPYNRLTLVTDFNKELVDLGDGASDEFKQIIYNVGAEYWYSSTIALRGGYIHDEDGQIKTMTVGVGLALENMHLDIGYIPSQDNLPLANTVRYSFTGRF